MSLAFQIHASLDAVGAHMLPIMYPACITHVFLKYPSCILIVSSIVVMTRPRYMYRYFVSRCILMYLDEESKIHVS